MQWLGNYCRININDVCNREKLEITFLTWNPCYPDWGLSLQTTVEEKRHIMIKSINVEEDDIFPYSTGPCGLLNRVVLIPFAKYQTLIIQPLFLTAIDFHHPTKPQCLRPLLSTCPLKIQGQRALSSNLTQPHLPPHHGINVGLPR